MKTSLLAIAASALIASSAAASESERFLQCTGAHHGWYLEFYAVTGTASPDLAQVNIVVSTDADPEEVPYKVYQIQDVKKYGATIQTKAYRWALKEAVRKGYEYGYVTVKASGSAGDMYINFNIFGDAKLGNAVFIDGHMQSLTCTVN